MDAGEPKKNKGAENKIKKKEGKKEKIATKTG